MMVSFFKGYHVFIRPPESGSGEEDGDGGGAPYGEASSQVEFDVLGFLSFAKADLRPFLRVLLRTRAFAAFLADARCSKIIALLLVWHRTLSSTDALRAR